MRSLKRDLFLVQQLRSLPDGIQVRGFSIRNGFPIQYPNSFRFSGVVSNSMRDDAIYYSPLS